jgi:hypothetical protein
MGSRFSTRRAFLPILILAGFTLAQAAGISQTERGGARQIARPGTPAGRTEARQDDAELRRLVRSLKYFRSIGDRESAARIFARIFPMDAVVDPSVAAKTAASSLSNRIEGTSANDKAVAGNDHASPVFVSPEHEKNPSADTHLSADGMAEIFSAAEQWSDGRPKDIRIRKSPDRGLTWLDTVALGDGHPWTDPSLRLLSEDAIGLAFVKDRDSGDGDIHFVRLSADLAADAAFPVALSRSDQRSPSLVTDRAAYSDAYAYIAYAERTDAASSVEFRVSPDFGTSWSRAATIDSFPLPEGTDVETAAAYDPDRNSLHVAYIRPQGTSTGIAVATSRDFGASWSRPVFVTPADGLADSSPRIAAAGGRVIVVYEHQTAAGPDIGSAHSRDSARSWMKGANLAASAAAERSPDVRASEGTGAPRFFASYIEENARVLVLRDEASGAGAWTTEAVVDDGRASASAGPVAVVPVPGRDGSGTAGTLWAIGSADLDIYFGSEILPLSLAALEVTPANQNVSYLAGTTSFSVARTGEEPVAWTASVTSGASWLTLSSGSSGTDAGTIIAAYERNEDSGERIGTMQVTPADIAVPTVSVTVTQEGAPVGTLYVTPANGLTSTGPEGGPFTPSSQAYTLRNVGTTSINWRVARVESWTSLSSTLGNLSPGETRTVTVSIDNDARSLPAGTHTDTVSFMNTTNGNGNTTRPVSLTVSSSASSLSVAPAGGLDSTGPLGGPFAPSSQDYTLQNTGLTSFDWTATKTQPWTTLSATSGTLAAGETATVTVSINAGADALTAGTYNDTVSFTNTTDGSGDTTRAVTLTVSPPPGVLSVTPAGGLASTGPAGGPFTPSSQAYTLENTGGSSLSWTASKTQSWTTLSATLGTLAAGETAVVTVSINSAADALAAGIYADTVTFTNAANDDGGTTRAVSLTVTPAEGSLSVTPAGEFASTGSEGGPFTPASLAYTLENTGGTPIDWTATKTQSWTTLSSTSGTLASGATATVTVSIDSGANALAAGTYNDAVSFTNTTNGSGDTTRAVALTVTPPPGILSLTPAGGLASTGSEGGPFTPTSLAYTLENTGGTPIDWTATKTQSWTTLSATSGTLASGAMATVTVSINAAANALAAGPYADTVTFTNTTNGTGNASRPVSLAVSADPVLAVSPSGRGVAFTSGTTTFDVANAGGGTLNWTAAVIAGGSWLTIASGAGGTGGGTITVAFADNRTASERVGIVRVTAAGAGGSPKDVTVTQASGTFSLTLAAARLTESAWIISRQYGRLTVTVANPASIAIDRYVIYRKVGGGAFQILQEVAGSAVAGTSWITNDTFLEPGTGYTYRVVALDAVGGTIGTSNDVAI